MGDVVLAKMYSQTFSMDVVIKVENDERQIQAHRAVLIGASDYFQTMFKEDFQEKDSKEIILKEISFDSVNMLVEFVYTGKLNFEKCSIGKAVQTADYLMIDCAIWKLDEYISKNISVENCLDIYGAFEVLKDEVRNQVETFIRKNLVKLVQSGISSLNFNQLERILKNPTPVVDLSDCVAIVEWVKKSPDERSKYVPKLLPHIVIRSSTHNTMKDLISSLLPICKCAESKDYLIALLTKGYVGDSEFTRRYFNDQNWKV